MIRIILLALMIAGCNTKERITTDGVLYCGGMSFNVTYSDHKYYLKGTNRRVITHAYNSICYVEN